MKLKGLNKRAHNILFHTHTVTGIVISFLLFIIFYAGAFSLFQHEAYRWENPYARYESPKEIDLENIVNNVFDTYPQLDKSDNISIAMPSKYNPEIKIYVNEIVNDSTQHRKALFVNTQTLEISDEHTMKSHLIETLVHLHYLQYIPFGVYIAGLVALFFTFASITGLLIHWKNIVDKFYMLRTKKGLKNLWKDAHTTLGLISLPFQIIYGITGAFLGLSILILAPAVFLLFDGDQNQVRGAIDPFFAIESTKEAPTNDNISLNKAIKIFQEKYPTLEVANLRIKNYDNREEAVSLLFDNEKTLGGSGSLLLQMRNGEILNEFIPDEKGLNNSLNLVSKLHYATFGGLLMKFIYFILALITCVIIISGILLWQSARDNKKYTDKQRRFNHQVTRIYLNICMSLVPATALLFLANMYVPFDMINRIETVNNIFFAGWGVLCLCGFLWNNYGAIFKYYFVLSAILGLFIPIANGLVTQDWLWATIPNGNWSVAGVDIFWVVTSLIIFSCYFLPKKANV